MTPCLFAQQLRIPTLTRIPGTVIPSSVQILQKILLFMTTILVSHKNVPPYVLNLLISAFVPYCSSDCYTGTKNSSLITDGLTFHGKYIVKAILDDLIQNTWITEAEEVKRSRISNKK